MNKQEIQHALLKANAYAQLPFPEDQKWLTQSIVDEVYALWMQQNQSGMRWVRASERLPEHTNKNVIWRHTHRPISGLGYHSFSGFKNGADWHDEMDFIEWIDESASSEVERLRKALADIAAMKLLPGETDHKYAYNRCWHIAIDALK